MTDQIIQILIIVVSGVVGTFGIVLLFGAEAKKIPWTLLAAALTSAAYEIAFRMGAGYFLASLVAAALVAAYSDVMAHVLKTPATVIITAGIVPLVPGGMLYYTMLGAVNSDIAMFSEKGKGVLLIAAGLAVGVIAVTAISRPINAKLGEIVAKSVIHAKKDK